MTAEAKDHLRELGEILNPLDGFREGAGNDPGKAANDSLRDSVCPTSAAFRPPYHYETSEHGPVTIYDAVDVGWIARVKESLPFKEELAAAMVDGLNAAAGNG